MSLEILMYSITPQAFSGDVPFADYKRDAIIIGEVNKGSRPSKPDAESLGLSNLVWRLAEDCWDHKAEDRPRAAEVRARLESALHSWNQVRQGTSVIEQIRGFDSGLGSGKVQLGIPIGN